MHDFVITTASWEDRFFLGTKKNLLNNKPEKLLAFYYKEYQHATLDNRQKLMAYCKELKVEYIELELCFSDPANSWKRMYNFTTEQQFPNGSILIDLSTTPRETSWSLMNILSDRPVSLEYIYNKPEKYNDVWLSREPAKPRIVYKMGGIVKFNVPTILVIQTGYDLDRVVQLVQYFDPKVTLLGLQTGTQFENEIKNNARCKECFQEHSDVHMFHLDAYGSDQGYSEIKKVLEPYIDQYNILISSLGPKLGAVSIYKIFKEYNERGIGLVYAPSDDFNPEYSSGLGASHSGLLP